MAPCGVCREGKKKTRISSSHHGEKCELKKSVGGYLFIVVHLSDCMKKLLDILPWADSGKVINCPCQMCSLTEGAVLVVAPLCLVC